VAGEQVYVGAISPTGSPLHALGPSSIHRLHVPFEQIPFRVDPPAIRNPARLRLWWIHGPR
jgi:hypothetical protein